MENIRLTETVQKGGCAAKLPAGQLRSVLKSLNLTGPKELVVGAENLDDACLWDLGDGRYLVQTLDFFTPIVDPPKDFGAIAAANSLSDIFAMGGTPKTAMTILCFPSTKLPMELISPLMAGALEKIIESGACLAGGHSIDDETIKLGFSVSGFVDKNRVWTNAGAQVGDALILTKGLGTGTITSALKNKLAKPEWIQAATDSMKQLNQVPRLLEGITVHSATDITGFGLAGHAVQMAQASQKTFRIQTSQLPTITGAMECLEQKILNRAHRTNSEYTQETAKYGKIPEALRWLTVDPQTSGGLLLSLPKPHSQLALERLISRFPRSTIIGEVISQELNAVIFE